MRMTKLAGLVMESMVESGIINDNLNKINEIEIESTRIKTHRLLCRTNRNRELINEVSKLVSLKPVPKYSFEYAKADAQDDCKWAVDRVGTIKSNIRIVLEYINRQNKHQMDKLKEISNKYPV